MTIDLLICTIDEGIKNVPDVLMPPMDGIGYVVSMQFTDEDWLDAIPSILCERSDVKVVVMKGRGLSANRNSAIAASTADVCLIADDDCRYTKDRIDALKCAFEENADADIITSEAEDFNGQPLKKYPAAYVSSVEIAFKRRSVVEKGLAFNPKFGLGSEFLCAGEEEIFLKDAGDKGLKILFVPIVIVKTNAVTTGSCFIENPKMQRTKGCVFRYKYGVCKALWLTVKEAGWYMVHERVSPLQILINMIKGIWT